MSISKEAFSGLIVRGLFTREAVVGSHCDIELIASHWLHSGEIQSGYIKLRVLSGYTIQVIDQGSRTDRKPVLDHSEMLKQRLQPWNEIAFPYNVVSPVVILKQNGPHYDPVPEFHPQLMQVLTIVLGKLQWLEAGCNGEERQLNSMLMARLNGLIQNKMREHKKQLGMVSLF